MNQFHDESIVPFKANTTLQWLCDAGDLLFWFRCGGLMAAMNGKVDLADSWFMCGGEALTITNQVEDLPAWFELHPTEVTGLLASKMIQKLNSGYEPGEIIEGPNLWRPKAGDKIAWTGRSRPGHAATNGLLALLDFKSSALVVGASNAETVEEFLAFGAPTRDAVTQDQMNRFNVAKLAVDRLGRPDSLELDWKLG